MKNAQQALAALFNAPGQPFEFRALPLPERIAPGELLVEISMATICGSDLHTLEGRRHESTPAILGHEAVGKITAIGLGRDPELLGRRVTWTLADSCGTCRPCREWSLPQKCESLFKYGHAPLQSGSGLNGCYATHVLLRAGTTVIAIPDSVTDAMAAPANCALATMIAATEDFADGGKLALIQGAGLLGLLGCALLRSKGWQRVVVADTNPARLALVPGFGGEPALGSAKDRIAPGTVDGAIEATGQPSVIPEGIALLRPGGRYQWVGMVHPDSRLELTGEMVIRKCLTIQGTHNYSPRHLAGAVKFLETQGAGLPWDRLVSPPFALSQLDGAVTLARSGRWPRVAIQPSMAPQAGVVRT